jgi:hypothetical protein
MEISTLKGKQKEIIRTGEGSNWFVKMSFYRDRGMQHCL